MSKENLNYSYELYDEPESVESYIGPVLMGREREYFARRNQIVEDFKIEINADLNREQKKKVDTSGQLFGISSQNLNQRVSLDEKYPADLFFCLKADNMFPYILPGTDIGLKFSDQHASGEVCVYRYKGKPYCNVIKIINGKLYALSYNQKYKPVILEPDEYYFIAVVTCIHKHVRPV